MVSPWTIARLARDGSTKTTDHRCDDRGCGSGPPPGTGPRRGLVRRTAFRDCSPMPRHGPASAWPAAPGAPVSSWLPANIDPDTMGAQTLISRRGGLAPESTQSARRQQLLTSGSFAANGGYTPVTFREASERAAALRLLHVVIIRHRTVRSAPKADLSRTHARPPVQWDRSSILQPSRRAR